MLPVQTPLVLTSLRKRRDCSFTVVFSRFDPLLSTTEAEPPTLLPSSRRGSRDSSSMRVLQIYPHRCPLRRQSYGRGYHSILLVAHTWVAAVADSTLAVAVVVHKVQDLLGMVLADRTAVVLVIRSSRAFLSDPVLALALGSIDSKLPRRLVVALGGKLVVAQWAHRTFVPL